MIRRIIPTSVSGYYIKEEVYSTAEELGLLIHLMRRRYWWFDQKIATGYVWARNRGLIVSTDNPNLNEEIKAEHQRLVGVAIKHNRETR